MAVLTDEQRASREVLRRALARDRLARLRPHLVAHLALLGYDDRARAERAVDRAMDAWMGVTR
ncbi:hypothetical protein [Microbacterium sp. BR1]|uniref:hypothetical protein n=1 Tax=Microbacterium sp. BR1 TaxID=1070896 RepID=UPI000C2BC6C8|nr:hypothetical protein [Microbacterium sp. BR1]